MSEKTPEKITAEQFARVESILASIDEPVS